MEDYQDYRMSGLVQRRKRCISSIYAEIAAGLYPRPVKRGRSSIFPGYEVAAFELIEAAGVGEAAIRRFVEELHVARFDGERIDPRQWLAAYRNGQTAEMRNGKSTGDEDDKEAQLHQLREDLRARRITGREYKRRLDALRGSTSS